ncbi:MAG: oligosaccharide flippase family protein, partial [Deltaproteobacteria bacterium]|nr:oligosaccharide flippase family protein [Deltaproteobacteria bacterium]
MLALLFCSWFLFCTRYRYFIPSLKNVDFRYARELVGLGLNFFLIRIATIVLFMSSSILIAHLFSPREVTVYQVAYKFFQLILVVFMIIVNPLWSAAADAYHRKDYIWIQSS